MSEMPGGMVERVSRALLRHLLAGGRINADELARVAIAALREPTEAMVRIGNIMYGDELGCQAEQIWEAMIAAALGEGR